MLSLEWFEVVKVFCEAIWDASVWKVRRWGGGLLGGVLLRG